MTEQCQPTSQNIENAAIRAAIAEKQNAAYSEVMAWADKIMGPEWYPSGGSAYNPLSTYGEIQAALDQYGPPPDFLPRPTRAPQEAAILEVAASLACPEQAAARVRYVGGWAATLAALAAVTPNANPENDAQLALLRDVLGNPFRPVTLAARQRTPTVVSVARAAYDERQLPRGDLDQHRLAVLADALEEAGATGELVEHLRSPGPHVRGCWALDLVLGLT